MTTTIRHRPNAVLALAAVVLGMVFGLLLSSPPGAQASETPYCYGRILSNYGRCVGVGRNFNALYGDGVQHSVCIWASQFESGEGFVGSIKCSSGPGAGAYNASMGELGVLYWYPVIKDNAAGSNQVYGTSFTP